MKKKQISAADILSPIVVGSWKWGTWGAKLTTNEIYDIIETCLEAGVSSFDHADIYGHYSDEGEFGKALAKKPALRQQMQIVTKCSIMLACEQRPNNKIKYYDSSKAHIIWSVENSLKEFGTDYLDILLLHRPDHLLDADEVAEVFTKLKKQGKVLHLGVSNYSVSQFNLLNSRVPLVTNQIEASIVKLDPFYDGTLDQAQELRRAPMIWSPLGSGKIFTDTPDERTKRIQAKAQQLSEKHNATIDQILLAWLLMHPSKMIPILGTSKIDRIKSALGALKVQLSHQDWYDLLESSTGKMVP
jgi:predicted oxidoreductase